MRIGIDATIDLLNPENEDLRKQMDSCNNQISNINKALANTQLLKGKAYDALRERISMRPNILKAHYISYESLLSANEQNIRALSSLPRTSWGVLDTAVCDERIAKAESEIRRLESFKASAISRLNANPIPEDVPNRQYSKRKAINAITESYDALINAQRAIITKENENKRRAAEYDSLSLAIYSSVNQDIETYLVPANASVEACLKTGSYAGTTGWVNSVNSKFKKQKKLRDVLESGVLTEEEYRAYKNAIMNSKTGDISAEYLYKDGKFNAELYEILQKLSGDFVSDGDKNAVMSVYKQIFDNEDEDAFKIVFPDVDVAQVFASWRQATQESKSSLLSDLGVQFANVMKGQLKSKVANMMAETLSEFYRMTHPIPIRQAVTVTGVTVNVTPDAEIIAARIGALAKTAPYFGCALDATMQVYSGENVNHAINKAVVHTAISVGLTIAAGVLFSNPVGLAGVAVFAGVAITGMFISGKFDEWYDSTFKMPSNNY